MLLDRVRGILWKSYMNTNGAKVGCNFRVHGQIDILLRDGASLENVEVGDDVTIGGKIYLRMRHRGRIQLKSMVTTGTEIWLVTANDAHFSVGANTALSSYSIFNGGHGITIGPDCIFAGFVYINSSEHLYRKGELIRNQGFTGSPVVLGRDVWLGGNVTVGKGVHIGDGAVIGAGAVVTRDIPDYAVAIGIPARVIKYRE